MNVLTIRSFQSVLEFLVSIYVTEEHTLAHQLSSNIQWLRKMMPQMGDIDYNNVDQTTQVPLLHNTTRYIIGAQFVADEL